MMIVLRALVLACLALASVALHSAPAAAVPILYTFTGTLTLGSTMDTLNLDGATLTITAQVDSTTLPSSTSPGANDVLAFYNGIAATAVFSGRPNSVADETVFYTTRLLVHNHFPPSPGDDNFGISSANATVSSVTFGMPAISATFTDIAFLPGTGAPALPVFDASDVASFGAGTILTPIRYDVGNVNITSAVVPEPSTALLLGGGMLLVLATARRAGARL